MDFGHSLFGNNYQSGSIGNILYGIFGDAGKPYDDASNELSKYLPQAQQYQQPFNQAGTAAIPQFQNWLKSMQDPSAFINNLMGKYQESPGAKFQQQQMMNAADNMGSATGLTGSTPLTQFAQQQSQGIASQDMNNWLQNVLGTNNQFGAGQLNLMNMGQNSANQLMSLLQNYMGAQSGLAFGKDYAKQQQMGGLFSGLSGLFGF